MNRFARWALLAATLAALSLPAAAATRSLTCGGAKTINGELARMSPGDVLQVSGTCTENVVVPASMNDLRIQGVNGGAIQAPDATQPAVLVRGRGIRLSNLRIGGGQDGVLVLDGGFAWIDSNTISGNASWGIQVADTSTARIWNNLIEANFGGVLVNGSSFALIGAASASDANVFGNTIRNSTGDAGVHVTRSSSARVVGNTITGNVAQGVLALRGSQVDAASNVISGNGTHGIEVAHNSTLNLGQSSGTSLFALPNSGNANGGLGVQCTGGGYATGRLGSLIGNAGSFDLTNCAGVLAP